MNNFLNMNKIIAAWITAVMLSLVFLQTQALASDLKPLTIYLNGEKTELLAGTMGRTAYISLETCIALGGKVSYHEAKSEYSISSQSIQLKFSISKSSILVNNEMRQINKQAIINSGNIYVPLGWMVEILGMKALEDRLTSSIFFFTAPDRLMDVKTELYDIERTVKVSNTTPTLLGIYSTSEELRITTSGSVTPQIFNLQSPNRIVIDLPGTIIERSTDGNASGMIPLPQNHEFISNVRYSLFQSVPSVVRIVLDMKQSVPYQTEVIEDGRGIAIKFQKQEPIKVMIDAGHGGSDPGAISLTGKFEKDVNLAIAKKTADLLKQDRKFQVILSRSQDTYLSPADRVKLANQNGVDLFISIHANTASQPSVKGTETYYWREDSKTFANILHKHVVIAFGSTDRKVKQERFAVLRDTVMPAALLEIGFMTNTSDEIRMHEEQVQLQISLAIVAAIKEYYAIR
jgi:N-acetylmuramoyl-L-alanine amidase